MHWVRGSWRMAASDASKGAKVTTAFGCRGTLSPDGGEQRERRARGAVHAFRSNLAITVSTAVWYYELSSPPARP